MEREVVDNDPIYQDICLSKPPSCSAPAPPVVLDDPADDFVRPQELSFEATVPAGFVADRVKRQVEYVGAGGAILPLWADESEQGIRKDGAGNPIAGPYTIRLGAPGLLENTGHRFRVSFRRDSDDYWLCLSIRTPEKSTTAFSTFGPTPPVTVEVEDDFRRPETDFRSNAGDGLGPAVVWQESLTTARIASDGDEQAPEFSALLNPSVLERYAAEASNPHTYAEGLFRTAQPGFYNIDLFTKEHVVSQMPMVMNSYVLKLAYLTRGCDTNPTLFLLRAVEESGSSTCDQAGLPNPNLPPDAALVIPDPSQPKCNARPPLDVEDGADTFTPKRSQPVWLRIEADQSVEGDPIITATVAWNCPDNQVIGNCGNVCKLTRTDNVSSDMLLVKGLWGFWVHDKAYYLDFFRAGSDPFGP